MSEEFSAYFSEDDSEVYVVTDSLPKLKLRDEPRPDEAPLYINVESGKGYYPEEVDAETASAAAEYALEKASSDATMHLRQDGERWRNEFTELLSEEEDIGPFWSLNLDKRDPRTEDDF